MRREQTRVSGSRTRDNRRPRRRSERPVMPDLSNVVPITTVRTYSKRARWHASNGHRVELVTITLPGAPFDGTQRAIPPVEGTQFSVARGRFDAGYATTLDQLARWIDVSEITVGVFCAMAGIAPGRLTALANVPLTELDANCAVMSADEIVEQLTAIATV